MPFSYYKNLSRAQQAVYRKSDSIVDVRLARPADLHPLVAALEAATGVTRISDRPAARVHVWYDPAGASL